MNGPIKYKTSQRIFVVIVLFVVMLGAVYPRPAHAIPVKVIANIGQLPFDIIIAAKEIIIAVQSTLTAINTTYLQIKEIALDKVAWITSKIQLAREATQVISQIEQGFPASLGPLFVENWEGYSARARNNATTFFLAELNKTNKLDPAFQGVLRQSFNTNPYGNQSVFDRLRPTFKEDVRSYPGCEGGDCDTRAFLNDFSKGGWLGFQSLTNNPAHNPFTAYNILQQDLTERANRAEQAALDEARAAGGFLGTKDCPPETDPNFVGPPEPKAEDSPDFVGPPEPSQGNSILGTLRLAKCKILRPGSSVEKDIAGTLDSARQVLASVDEIQEIIGALQGIVGGTRSRGFQVRNPGVLQRAREDIDTEDRSTATEESERVIAKAQIMLSSVHTIWKNKEQSLNANAELKAELEKIVANRNLCEIPDRDNNDQRDIAINAEFDLLDVNERERELGKEVGIGNTVGTFAVGGSHSVRLAEKLADAQFLVKIIKNPGVLPSDQISQTLRNAFTNLPNPNDTEARLREARQRLGGAIAELEFAMAPFQGTIEQSAGELKQIRLEIEQAKRNQRACGII